MGSSRVSFVWPVAFVVVGVVLQLALGGGWGAVLILGGVFILVRQLWLNSRAS